MLFSREFLKDMKVPLACRLLTVAEYDDSEVYVLDALRLIIAGVEVRLHACLHCISLRSSRHGVFVSLYYTR